jgi:hypothetical protein
VPCLVESLTLGNLDAKSLNRRLERSSNHHGVAPDGQIIPILPPPTSSMLTILSLPHPFESHSRQTTQSLHNYFPSPSALPWNNHHTPATPIDPTLYKSLISISLSPQPHRPSKTPGSTSNPHEKTTASSASTPIPIRGTFSALPQNTRRRNSSSSSKIRRKRGARTRTAAPCTPHHPSRSIPGATFLHTLSLLWKPLLTLEIVRDTLPAQLPA